MYCLPHQSNIGKRLTSIMPTRLFSASGHSSGFPSGVFFQSNARISAPISPPPERNSRDFPGGFLVDFFMSRLWVSLCEQARPFTQRSRRRSVLTNQHLRPFMRVRLALREGWENRRTVLDRHKKQAGIGQKQGKCLRTQDRFHVDRN